jgi:hypothetical protein
VQRPNLMTFIATFPSPAKAAPSSRRPPPPLLLPPAPSRAIAPQVLYLKGKL